MFRSSTHSRFVGLLALGALCFCVASAPAQPPPKKGKGAKGPPDPAADAEVMTVRGTVRDFTTAPKGERDGVTLSDGTIVHWPPHLADRFSKAITRGDRVKVIGWMETGPAGDKKLEISSLTNLDTDRTVDNPDRPAPALNRALDEREQRLRALEEQVDQIQREIRRLRNER